MEKGLKVGACAAVGVGVLEFVYTTKAYQDSQFYAAGAAGGIIADILIAAVPAAIVGYFLL